MKNAIIIINSVINSNFLFEDAETLYISFTICWTLSFEIRSYTSLDNIFTIADKINSTENGTEIMMLIDDAGHEYDKHFKKILNNNL